MSGGSDLLDLEEVLRYAKEKDVGIILWAGYRAFDRDMEEVCRHYSALGVKGFKVDFMDRDDQQIAEFLYRGRLPPPNTDYCSTTTVYISLPVCNAPIPTSSISKAYMDWNR